MITKPTHPPKTSLLTIWWKLYTKATDKYPNQFNFITYVSSVNPHHAQFLYWKVEQMLPIVNTPDSQELSHIQWNSSDTASVITHKHD